MIKSIFISSIILINTTLSLAAPAKTAKKVNDQKPGWTLTFSDEFNGKEMDWSVWASEAGYPKHILSSRWPENAKVQHGCLRLFTRKQNRAGAKWTTANVWTRNFKQKYGYWEARYRIAAAPGLNNSFWLCKSNDFEIDIDEGHYPSQVNIALHNWSQKHWAVSKHYDTKLPLSKQFHIRALEWTPTELIFYFDHQEIFRYNYSKEKVSPSKPVAVRFSTAVIGWAGKVTDKLNGTTMDIDYIRVYEKNKEN